MSEADPTLRPTELPASELPGEGQQPLWRKLVFLIPVVALAWILYFVPIPYFVISPGPSKLLVDFIVV